MRSTIVSRCFQFAAALIFAFVMGVCFGQEPQFPFGLGDIPLTEDEYEQSKLGLDAINAFSLMAEEALATAEFDARARGWVTPAKNQMACGSCWSFAAAGTIESRILKDGGPLLDLSEQQNVSCNSYMHGCCGGSGSSLKFYFNAKPLLEADAPYSEGTTNCPPTERTIDCSTISGTAQPYLASGFYAVDRTVEAFKTSLMTHGPSYFRYDVYQDFQTYWQNGTPGQAYTNGGTNRLGGHAVLLIGWSDAKQAFLLKNSWGATGGPNGDGTFWLSYSGHANDLGMQMFNITTLSRTPDVASLQGVNAMSLVHEPGDAIPNAGQPMSQPGSPVVAAGCGGTVSSCCPSPTPCCCEPSSNNGIFGFRRIFLGRCR